MSDSSPAQDSTRDVAQMYMHVRRSAHYASAQEASALLSHSVYGPLYRNYLFAQFSPSQVQQRDVLERLVVAEYVCRQQGLFHPDERWSAPMQEAWHRITPLWDAMGYHRVEDLHQVFALYWQQQDRPQAHGWHPFDLQHGA